MTHILGQRHVLRTCRGCGCTDNHACPGGCAWVLLDLDTATGVCSTCAEELSWDSFLLARIGGDGGADDDYAPPPRLLTGT